MLSDMVLIPSGDGVIDIRVSGTSLYSYKIDYSSLSNSSQGWTCSQFQPFESADPLIC